MQPCDAQLLAHIIERATGEAYATYLSKALWKPIGAADAQLMLDEPGGTAHASCCLRAHLGDWMRIGQLLGERRQVRRRAGAAARLGESQGGHAGELGRRCVRDKKKKGRWPAVCASGARSVPSRMRGKLISSICVYQAHCSWIVPSLSLIRILRVGTKDGKAGGCG